MDSNGLTGPPSDCNELITIAHQMGTVPDGSSPPLVTSLQAWQPDKIRRQKEKEKKAVESINKEG